MLCLHLRFIIMFMFVLFIAIVMNMFFMNMIDCIMCLFFFLGDDLYYVQCFHVSSLSIYGSQGQH